MAREYVENRDGGYYVIGSRASLESVILLFLDGASPETIVDGKPWTLTTLSGFQGGATSPVSAALS